MSDVKYVVLPNQLRVSVTPEYICLLLVHHIYSNKENCMWLSRGVVFAKYGHWRGLSRIQILILARNLENCQA